MSNISGVISHDLTDSLPTHQPPDDSFRNNKMLSQQHFSEVGIPARDLSFLWGVGIPAVGLGVGIPEKHWFYMAFAFYGGLWWVGILKIGYP